MTAECSSAGILRALQRLLVAAVFMSSTWPTTALGQSSHREEVARLNVDFGEIPAGQRECRRTGLIRQGWQIAWGWVETTELPRGVRLQSLVYDDFPAFDADQFCVKTEPWTPSHPRETLVLRYERSDDSPRRPGVYVAEVRATFSVKRTLGLVHVVPFVWFPPIVLLIALVVHRRRPDFDQELIVAWKIDREAGYRDAGHMDWTFRPLAELDGAKRRPLRQQRISLHRVLDSTAELDAVALEPFPEGEVLVDSRLVMVVQPHDEPMARETSGELTIVPGTVVRVGRLLFTVLAPEVAEAVKEGRVQLPEPGGAAVEGRQSVVGGLRAHLAHRQPGLWGWLLLAFGPALIALAFAMSGVVYSSHMVAALSAVIMVVSVAILQVIRRYVAARRR